ncbi:MAG: response regulator transcription factor [Planctomycetota bacterium]|jgi:DNA-binding response OmpR family regulator
MEPKASILIIEDEEKIRTALMDFLEFHGFKVTEAVDGLEAERSVVEKRFDLILLDLMLPKISGEQLCTKWRRDGLQTPVIMLTAKSQEKEKVTGLNLGADDYITKPFSLEELLARIKAVLRRIDPARAVGQTFKFADLDVDIAALKVKRAGGVDKNKQIEITKREAAILQYFAANPNRVISREELYKEVWEETMTELGTRTTDMHIAKLRSKIEKNSADPQIIKTVRGAGYKYEH